MWGQKCIPNYQSLLSRALAHYQMVF